MSKINVVENNLKKNNFSTVDALDIDLLSFEPMECPRAPRLKVLDLFPEYDKPNTTCFHNDKESKQEEILLFRGHHYTSSKVDCGGSGALELGIVVF